MEKYLPPTVEIITPPKKRTWLVRIVTLLLILQGVILASICYYLITQQPWQNIALDPIDQRIFTQEERLTEGQSAAIEIVVFFLPLAGLVLLSALLFFFMLQLGWVLAMLMQGLTLAACLNFYLNDGPGLIYPVMGYAILMILYLNSSNIRSTFVEDTGDGEAGAAA